MPRTPPSRGRPGPSDGPAFVDTALIFAVDDAGAGDTPVRAGSTGAGGTADAVAIARAYAERNRHRGASLKPLGARADPDRAMSRSAGDAATEQGGTFYLTLASAGDADELAARINADPLVRYVTRPAMRYPLDRGAPGAPAALPRSRRANVHPWSLRTCRFPDAWQRLEQGHEPGAIGMVDEGSATGQPELEGRITRPFAAPDPSPAVHAASVAGMLAAARAPGSRVVGCCQARILLYNAWQRSGGYHPETYYAALEDMIARGVRVVNLSIGGVEPDPREGELIASAAACGIVFVAAMGDEEKAGNPPLYPAAYPGVIAVGGTARNDLRAEGASSGPHIWISAPSEEVRVLHGRRPLARTGTSYAAPQVAAAVWLALVRRPGLSPATIREVLARSAASAPPGGFSDDVGHGRLDVVRMADALDAMEG